MWSAKCQPSYLLSRPWYIETLRMRQNGHHFADDIFKCIFFIKNIWITIKISMKFIAKGPVGNNSTLVHIMAWHYLCQAIIWSNDGTVCWYINTALGLYELAITLQVWVPYLYKTRTWSSLRLLIDVSSGHFVDCIKSDMIFFFSFFGYIWFCMCFCWSNNKILILQYVVQAPVSLAIFLLNSNSMENSPCCNWITGLQCTTKLCACHDSTAVVPCAKFCGDQFVRAEVRAKWNFLQI